MDIGLYDDDLDDLIEKPINRVKSAEELRSHMIDENLNEFGKTIFLLNSSYEAQVIVGIQSIPLLLKLDKSQCVHRIFPKFKETCLIDDTNRSLEFYQTIGSTMSQILASGLISSKDFANYFIDCVANKVYAYSEKSNDYENTEIFKNWTEVIFEIVNLLPENLIKSFISDSITKIKTQYSSRKCREYLCFLLARSAPKVSSQTNLNMLFPVMLDLCNDTQYEIRATACRCLATLSKNLGSEICIDVVVPEMFKFLCDESMLVRTSCFQSLVDLLDLFHDYDAKNYLLKKIQSFIEYGLSTRDENYLLTVSKNLAIIIDSFQEIMSSQIKLFFVDVFHQLCKNESLFSKRSVNETKYNWNMCKISLASAFPNVISITNSVNFENKLSQCLASLVKDRNEKVREAIASQMITIAEKLGKQQQHLIISDFCASMSDSSVLVQTVIVNCLEKFLKLFVKHESNGFLTESQQMPGYQLILKRLFELENSISQSYKYSLHVLILDSLALMPWLVSTDVVVDRILPLLETRIDARALPVRQAASRAMLIILRKIPRLAVRNHYFDKLLQFSVHKSCYKRIFFIDICSMVLQLYSKNFFKGYFYQPCIRLAQDKVVNVRISFVKILVDLKRIWRFQVDRDKLDNLESIAKTLLHDRDKDVFELAQRAIVQMDFIKSYNETEERLNRVKEEEENYWFELEPRKSQKNDPRLSSSFNKIESASATNLSKAAVSRNLSRSTKTSGQQNLRSSLKIESNLHDRPHSLVDMHHKLNSTEKRTQNLSLTLKEKPKVKPLQQRRNSINSEMYNSTLSSASPVNSRTSINSIVKKK